MFPSFVAMCVIMGVICGTPLVQAEQRQAWVFLVQHLPGNTTWNLTGAQETAAKLTFQQHGLHLQFSSFPECCQS